MLKPSGRRAAASTEDPYHHPRSRMQRQRLKVVVVVGMCFDMNAADTMPIRGLLFFLDFANALRYPPTFASKRASFAFALSL